MKNKILKIAIVGKTNAGKSTLVNNIVGEKISIQNKKINTTKDTVIGIKNIKKTQLIFYDTPGSNFLKTVNRESKNLKINLWNGIDQSDLLIYLIDLKTVNKNFLFEQIEKLSELKKNIIIVFNKIDIVSSKITLPLAIFHVNDILEKPDLIQMDCDIKSGKEWLDELAPIDNEIYEFSDSKIV